MKKVRFWIVICLSFLLILIFQPLLERLSPVAAQVPQITNVPTPNQGQPELQPFDEAIKDHEKLQGLFTLYRHPETGKVLAEIRPDQLDRNFLAVMTLESGLGERGIYRGIPLNDLMCENWY